MSYGADFHNLDVIKIEKLSHLVRRLMFLGLQQSCDVGLWLRGRKK